MAPDRPDLLDVNLTFVPKKPVGNASGSSVRIAAGEYYYFGYVAAYGNLSGYTGSTGADVSWTIFEPDTTRRSSRLASATQRNYVLLSIRVGGEESSFSTTTIVDGCGAHARLMQNPLTSLTKARWWMSCKGDALENLGLSPTQIETLSQVLGLRRLRISNRGEPPGFIE